MSDLRAACIHGRYELHRHHLLKLLPEVCPGGREVTIDYEAAAKELRTWSMLGGFVTSGDARPVVDAAIRDGE